MNAVQRALSWLMPLPVEQGASRLNPGLEVCLENGRFVLNSRNANYSFGHLHRVFRLAFQDAGIAAMNPGSVLVLGLGAGSIPSILYGELGLSCATVGVEYDEEVIRLGKKYFNLGKWNNLRIVCSDAWDYLHGTDRKFDLIAVDLFIDQDVPERFESPEFFVELRRHLNDRGCLLFNKILRTEADIRRFSRLFDEVLGPAEITATGNNRVFRAVLR